MSLTQTPPHAKAAVFSPAGGIPAPKSEQLAAGEPDPALVHEMRQEIRVLVQEIAQLSQQPLPGDEFFGGFLSRVVSALAAVGGAVWLTGEGNSPQVIAQVNLAACGLEGTADAARQHAALMKRVLESGQPALVPPKSGTAAEAANPSDYLLVLSPLKADERVVGVVEVCQRPGGGPATQRGYARFLSQMCDLAVEYLRSQKLRELADRQQMWQQLEVFLQAIHRSLDLRETSYAIVNEGRRLIGCDRLSLAIGDGRSAQITTVSGLDSIDRRASEIGRLSALARTVLRTGEPLWHAGGSEDLPPQIANQLEPYLDASHARLLGVVPLLPPSPAGQGRRRPLGALIVEQLADDRAGTALKQRTSTVAQHSAAALSHALEYRGLFLLPVLRLIGKLTWFCRGGTLPWTVAAVVLLAVGIAALAVVPADFEIAASGKLQPVERRDVFVRIDGDVTDVMVTHGQSVQPGDMLVKLANHELAEEQQRLLGRQRTNQEQISATNKRLLDSARGSGSRLTPADEAKLAGSLLELKQEADNIRGELAIFAEKQKRLKIIAEQAGQIVTWQVQELLLRRPVVRGQVLMTIANPDGPWELELFVPERRLKHVLGALKSKDQPAGGNGSRPPLDVVFALASHPGQEFPGEVVEIEQTAEVRGEEGNCVLVRVAVNRDELPLLHDQTTVTARLYCGRRSLGFVWFCDLIETVQSKVLFWL